MIYCVEDNEGIRNLVTYTLAATGFEARGFESGTPFFEALEENAPPNLVLLDIMLPGLNGLEVLRRLRKTSDVPVIMLTARDAVMDKVTGLDMGADDYITKPFSIEELLARIRTALRRKNAQALPQLVIGPLVLDVARHTLTVAGENVDLTGREFSLLQVLMENKDIVLTRDVLMERVWGYDYLGETNVVDVYIRYLRKKIDDPFDKKLIQTVRGRGYVLREDA